MSRYHCLECGTKLRELSYNSEISTYHCDGCNRKWYRKVETMVVWNGYIQEQSGGTGE